MRFMKKQLSVWRIVLIVGVATIAIPITARVSPSARADHKERQDYLDQQTTADNEDADDTHSKAKHSKESKAAVGPSVALLQDLLYDRRSQYWDKRVLRRLESREEYLDEQTKDDNDADAKDSKADKDGDDEDYSVDKEEELERRREYWRQRLDKEW
ncbi:MAG: hypothetical protein WAL47_01980 [Pyrinomonadaceae bacterium]